MKTLTLFSHKSVLLILLLSTFSYSQNNYLESFNASDGVEVSVNSSYTDIIFETWNKNKVEVEAFIDDKNLSEKEKQQRMKNWDLSITGNSKKISIRAAAENPFFPMGEMPQMDFIGPMMESLVFPIIQNVKVPPLPKELFENIGSIQFDYEEYQKQGEAYMKKFEAQMDKKFGKDFEKKMEAWGKNFEKSWDDKNVDSIGVAYGKRMEEWGEAYGKKMEAWAQQFENDGGDYKKTVTKSPNGTSIVIQGNRSIKGNEKGKKTIIIRMPKTGSADVNLRYGSLKMEDANNIRANLNYTSFIANTVDGKRTEIKVAYAPVTINTWKQGVLNLKFVDNCSLERVENLSLQANSSDVSIGNISKQAFLSGSYGDLKVDKVSSSFETLDINLENTDAKLNLPAGDFSFYFNGKKSTLKYPKTLQLKESKTADRVVVKGFSQNNNFNKTITINSTYSNILIE